MIESIVRRTGNVVGHLFAAGLVVDAVDNAIQGNYDLAAAEVVTSLYVEVSKYIENKRRQTVNEFCKKANDEYIPQLKAMNERINTNFSKLFNNMNNYSKQ